MKDEFQDQVHKLQYSLQAETVRCADLQARLEDAMKAVKEREADVRRALDTGLEQKARAEAAERERDEARKWHPKSCGPNSEFHVGGCGHKYALESARATIHMLSTPSVIDSITRGIEDIKAGRVKSLDCIQGGCLKDQVADHIHEMERELAAYKAGVADTKRLDWMVQKNAQVLMCSTGGWDVFVVGDQGEPDVVHLAHGENPREAIDAAIDAARGKG